MINFIGFIDEIYEHESTQKKQYSLIDMLTTSLYALMFDAESWLDIEEICDIKEEELRKFLKLNNGIPSYDLYQRVFAKFNPTALSNALTKWADSLFPSLGKKTTIDKQTLGKALDIAHEQSIIYSLDAFIVDDFTVIRHEIKNQQDNELTLNAELIKGVNIKEATIIIDSIKYQKDITIDIRKKKADYLISLQENQENLYAEVKEYFKLIEKNKASKGNLMSYQEIKISHESINRSYICLDIKDYPLSNAKNFKDLNTLIQVNHTGEKADEQRVSYYLSSLEYDAKKLSAFLESHWTVESSSHDVLDIVCKENEQSTRKDYSEKNFSLLRKVSLTLINLHKEEKQKTRQAKLHARMTKGHAIFLLFGKNIEWD